MKVSETIHFCKETLKCVSLILLIETKFGKCETGEGAKPSYSYIFFFEPSAKSGWLFSFNLFYGLLCTA